MNLAISLEAFEAERADFARLLDAVRSIQLAAVEELRDTDWLADLIRRVGLIAIPDAERTYGDDAEYLNASQQGLIQLPREFARFLVLLSEHRVSSYLEIGTYNGASASLAAAYLRRFHPELRAVTVDVFPGFLFYSDIQKLLPWLEYAADRTSFDFRGEQFDAVFIDGDHSFEWAWADYQNVGRQARICAMHDVNNAPYLDLPLGGVPAVWEILKRSADGTAMVEIFEHPSEAVLGIGVKIARP